MSQKCFLQTDQITAHHKYKYIAILCAYNTTYSISTISTKLQRYMHIYHVNFQKIVNKFLSNWYTYAPMENKMHFIINVTTFNLIILLLNSCVFQHHLITQQNTMQLINTYWISVKPWEDVFSLFETVIKNWSDTWYLRNMPFSILQEFGFVRIYLPSGNSYHK